MSLFKCIRGLVSENTLGVNVLRSPKTHEICRKELLSYFFVIVTQVESEKLFLIISEILGLLDNTLTANSEYSRRNRENLQFPIQIRLSKEP